MRVSWQSNRTALTTPYGIRLVVNPKCGMYLEPDGPVCSKEATHRVTRKGWWSLLWCEEHAAVFDRKREDAA